MKKNSQCSNIPIYIVDAVAILIGNFENQFMPSIVFKFVPEYFKLEDFISQTIQYPSTTILLTCITYVVANAFVLPVIEELYFRGF